MREPREWIIPLGVGGYYDGKEVHYAVGPLVDGPLPNPGHIEVIEKSAYDELLKENCRLKAKEINGTLRTYDGTLTAYDEKIKKLEAENEIWLNDLKEALIEEGIMSDQIDPYESKKVKDLKAKLHKCLDLLKAIASGNKVHLDTLKQTIKEIEEH